MRASGRSRFLRRWSSPKAATSSTSGVTAALHRPGACSVYRPRAVAINPAVMLSADSGRDDVPVGGGSWLSSRASLGSRSLGPFWATALLADRLCSEALARSVLSTASPGNPCVSASGTRPLLQTVLAIISTERSDAVGSGVSGIGGEGVARPSLRSSGLAVSAELVRPMARRSGIGGLAGAATRFTAVARRGGFGGAPAGGGRRSGRST